MICLVVCLPLSSALEKKVMTPSMAVMVMTQFVVIMALMLLMGAQV